MPACKRDSQRGFRHENFASLKVMRMAGDPTRPFLSFAVYYGLDQFGPTIAHD